MSKVAFGYLKSDRTLTADCVALVLELGMYGMWVACEINGLAVSGWSPPSLHSNKRQLVDDTH